MQVTKELFLPWYNKVGVKKINIVFIIKSLKGVVLFIITKPKLIQRNGPGPLEWEEAPYKHLDHIRMIY